MRTTSAAVGLIIEIDATVNGGDISPFIETASSLVDDICVPLLYSDTKLELIERWLSAHFYAIRDARTKSEGVGSLSQSFEGQSAMGLAHTRYGQQAMMLDIKGGLAGLNRLPEQASRIKPGILYVGSNDSSTTAL